MKKKSVVLMRVLVILAVVLSPLAMAIGPFYGPDIDRNNVVSLDELLRAIQFYNSLGFHCNVDTEDGYEPGPGSVGCDPYTPDRDPVDWQLSLDELLRVVQFYNSLSYVHCPDAQTEDGFAPGDTCPSGEGEGEGEGSNLVGLEILLEPSYLGGDVDVNPVPIVVGEDGVLFYESGTCVRVTATPAVGYDFVGWWDIYVPDPEVPTEATTCLVADKTISAVFTPLPKVTLSNWVGDLLGDGKNCDADLTGVWCILLNLGLVVDVTYVYDQSASAGTVLAQEPSTDTEVFVGSRVGLTVSAGPAPIIPNMTGMVFATANVPGNPLEDVGLRLCATAVEEYNSTFAAGTIIRTVPAWGQQAAVYDACVQAVVSLGSEPEGEGEGEGEPEGNTEGEPEGGTEGNTEGEPEGGTEGEGEGCGVNPLADLSIVQQNGHEGNVFNYLDTIKLRATIECGTPPYDGYMNTPSAKGIGDSKVLGQVSLDDGKNWIGELILQGDQISLKIDEKAAFQFSIATSGGHFDLSVLLTADTQGAVAYFNFLAIDSLQVSSELARLGVIVNPASAN